MLSPEKYIVSGKKSSRSETFEPVENGCQSGEKENDPAEENTADFREWAIEYIESIFNNPNQPPVEVSAEESAKYWASNHFDAQIGKYASNVYDNVKAGAGFSYSGHLKSEFLLILNDFVQTKIDQGCGRKQLEDILNYLMFNDFNHSDSIDGISSGDLLKLSITLNNNPLMRGYMGQSVNDTLVSQLSFYEGDMEALLKKSLDNATEAERLGMLYQLPTIAAKSLATSSWSSNTLNGIVTFLEIYSQDEETPVFEKLIAQRGLEQLRKEEESPTQSVLTYYGNQQAGRMAEGSPKTKYFDEVINPLMRLNPGEHIIQTSKDQLAIVDATNLPLYYAKVDSRQLSAIENSGSDEYDFSLQTLHEVQSFLESGGPDSLQSKKRLYDYLKRTYKGSDWAEYVNGLGSGVSQEDVKQLEIAENIFNQIQTKHQEYQARFGAPMTEDDLKREFSDYDIEKLNQASSDFINNFPFLEVQRRLSKQLLKKEVDLPQIDFVSYRAESTDNTSKDALKEQDLLKLQFLQRPDIAEFVSVHFGVDVRLLTTKEQFYFLDYLRVTTSSSVEPVREFLHNYNLDGMRTFLSLESQGQDFGDKIVAFGQHEGVAKHIFAYYGKLLDYAQEAEALVSDHETDTYTVHEVRDNILHRAQKDLVEAVETDDIASLAAKLDTYNAEAKVYVALLQETVEGDNIEVKRGGTLSNDDKTQMRTLLHANYYATYPDKEDEKFRKAVADSLEKHFDDPQTTFRVLYDGAKIVSFNRFDSIEEEYTGRKVTYFGSFNAAAPYSGVGGEMYKRTIAEQLQSGVPMMAHCDPTQKISQKYIESGFVATKLYPLAGKESFEIWQSDESSEMIRSKQMSIQELYEHGEDGGEDVTVRLQENSDTYPELNDGYALTRVFGYQGQRYVAFEVLPKELSQQFIAIDDVVEEKKAA